MLGPYQDRINLRDAGLLGFVLGGLGVSAIWASRLRCKTPCQRSVLLTGHILIAICDSADTWETGLGAVAISSIVRD